MQSMEFSAECSNTIEMSGLDERSFYRREEDFDGGTILTIAEAAHCPDHVEATTRYGEIT
jgi:hypothetical protein